jgi:hypothetical protein
LEDFLGSTTVFLPRDEGEDGHHFYAEAYPCLLAIYEEARADVSILDMTELVERAIEDCVTLVKSGKREDAENLLISTIGALREKSGTWDEMRRICTASNDAKGPGEVRGRGTAVRLSLSGDQKLCPGDSALTSATTDLPSPIRGYGPPTSGTMSQIKKPAWGYIFISIQRVGQHPHIEGRAAADFSSTAAA